MKALLSRFALRRSIGVVIEDRRVAVSVVVTTPLGRRQVFHDVQVCDVEPAQAVLERLLQPWIKPTRGKKTGAGPWVQLSVPEPEVFQAVVPITRANSNASPQAYFLQAVQSTNARAEDKIIDLLTSEVEKQPVACVAASPRGAINAIVEDDEWARNARRTG